MSLKERIGAAANAESLAWSDETTRAVDLISALGLAQVRATGEGFDAKATTRGPEELASRLWRLKYGDDHTPENYRHVLEGVCRRVHRGRDGRPRRDGRPVGWVLRAVIAIAVEEWRVETCPACRGRKFVGGIFDASQDTRAKVCGACGGMGIIQRSSDERADAVERLLRLTETARVQTRTKLLLVRTGAFIVSPRIEHVPNLRLAWEATWEPKYQAAIDTVVELDGRLASTVRDKLYGRRSA